MDALWQQRIVILDFAFQPIVNIRTGTAFGYEALLRNYQKLGFEEIAEVFDAAWLEGVLHEFDLALREKALRRFHAAGFHEYAHLFYNLDSRSLEDPAYQSDETLKMLEKYQMENRLCFEVNEQHQLQFYGEPLSILRKYRSQGIRIAADDYGAGFSGMQMLYYTEPEFIKIDRFFISDIATDHKKKHFVSGLLNTAHVLGSIVVAEGVETPREYYECLNIGCDLVQGYLVQPPETDTSKLQARYLHVAGLAESDKREKKSDRKLLAAEMDYVPPVTVETDVFSVFERFRKDTGFPFIPVVNKGNEPLGVVHEDSFKPYAYSRFGRELLQNKVHRSRLAGFLRRIPVVDVHCPAERILDVFSLDKTIDCILLTDHGCYVGFLSARSLLKILHEKNVQLARDQNPLTRLPGNNIIFEWIGSALEDTGTAYTLVYLDFDKFKPFNDRYGFRRGDRALLRFADILREDACSDLVAHIGGDDFFLGYKDSEPEAIASRVRTLCDRFAEDLRSFYDPDDLAAGCIIGKDRSGYASAFPLMTVSAILLGLPQGRSPVSQDVVGQAIALGKKEAKSRESHLWMGMLAEG